MTPNEKIEFLEPGKVVKLKPLSKAEDKHPNITESMRSFFGEKVTVKRVSSPTRGVFEIKESYNNWHVDWVEDRYFICLPQELFEIE